MLARWVASWISRSRGILKKLECSLYFQTFYKKVNTSKRCLNSTHHLLEMGNISGKDPIFHPLVSFASQTPAKGSFQIRGIYRSGYAV
jgi:hypothetical protein